MLQFMVRCKFLSLLIYDMVVFLTFYCKMAVLRLLSCHPINAIHATCCEGFTHSSKDSFSFYHVPADSLLETQVK